MYYYIYNVVSITFSPNFATKNEGKGLQNTFLQLRKWNFSFQKQYITVRSKQDILILKTLEDTLIIVH